MIKILNPTTGQKVTKKAQKPGKPFQPPEERKDFSIISELTISMSESERAADKIVEPIKEPSGEPNAEPAASVPGSLPGPLY